MITHTDKTSKNQNQTITNSLPKLRNNDKSPLQLIENKPEAIAQRELQDTINESPRMQHLKAYQAMANNSPQVAQLKTYQAMANNACQFVNRSLHSPIQLVKWEATGNNSFKLVSVLTKKEKKDGLDIAPKIKYNDSKIGQIYDTDTQLWQKAPKEVAPEVKEKEKISKQEYVGGKENESHIHQYGGDSHLKLGGDRYNIVQDGKLYDTYINAIAALELIKGERALWAKDMINYILLIASQFK